MATAESVKQKIQDIIYYVNQSTKENDATLTDVILRLLGGYNAASAVNAGVKTYGVDPTVERISAGDFVQLIPSWGSGWVISDISTQFAVVPLSDSKVVVVCSVDDTGYAVLLNADGVEATASDPVYLGKSVSSTKPLAAVALGENQVVVTYHEPSHVLGTYGCLMVLLTVAGDTISVGAHNSLSMSITAYDVSLTALTDNKALVVYRDGRGYGYAALLWAFGTTLVSDTAINLSSSLRNPKVVALTDSKALVTYEAYSDGKGKAIVLKCPDATITKGSEYEFRSASTSELALTALDDRRALVAYRDAAYTGYLYATVLQVVDATVTTFTTLQLTDYGGNKPEVTRVDTDKVLLVANSTDSNSGSAIQAQVLTVGESKITKGTPLVLKSGSTRDEARAVATLPNGAALVVIGNLGQGEGNVHTGWWGLDIDGTTVSRQLTSGTRVVPLTTTKYPIGVAKTSGVPSNVIFVYRSGEPATE